MDRKHFFIGLTAALLTACTPQTRKDVNTYADFPQTVELQAETMPIDTALFRYPFRIRTKGDTVTVMDLHGTDHFFHAFLGEDMHYLSSFGKRGEAPGEIIQAENIRLDNNGWWTLDSGKGKLTRLNASNHWAQPVEEVTLNDKDILRPLDFVRDEAGRFIVPDYAGKTRFCLTGTDGQLLQRMGDIPTTNEEALQNARPALAQAWRSFMDYNPRNGILAQATQLGDVLEIHNLQTGFHTVIYGPGDEPIFTTQGSEAFPKGTKGFNDVRVSDRYIYASYDGTTFKEKLRRFQAGEKDPDGGFYLHVYDLQGKLLHRMHLNRSIFGIHIDETSGLISATTTDTDCPVVTFKNE